MTDIDSSFQAPSLSNETIESRLETGAHGSRASLTKCAIRYRSFLQSIHADEANAEAIEESKHLLETELALYKVEFHKLALRVKTFQKELEQVEQQSQDVTARIAEKKKHVEALRQEMQTSKQVWGNKEEYEILAKMANHRPSRAILEKRLLLAQKQMQVAIQSQEALEQEMEMRQKQFRTLMQCMMDLKASVQEDENGSEGKEEEGSVDEDEDKDGVVPMDTTG